jgi:glycerol-3-phosphate cytidylyltransferase
MLQFVLSNWSFYSNTKLQGVAGKMKIVITYGTFDLLHYGHINLLRRAKNMGDYLIVGLSTDNFNLQKGKKSYFNFHERKQLLESIRYVDFVIPENNWEQKIKDIEDYKVDILVMGDDWKGKFDYLNEFCNVRYLSRTPEVSTSKIKDDLRKVIL